jgi:dihydroneopterin aldolase
MAIVALEGMYFRAHHGLFAEEQQNGNDFEVDVWIDTGIPVSNSDQISDALDYVAVYEVVKAEMEVRRDLLETLVAGIGGNLRMKFPSVTSIRVKVSKMQPPLGAQVRRSTVEDIF